MSKEHVRNIWLSVCLGSVPGTAWGRVPRRSKSGGRQISLCFWYFLFSNQNWRVLLIVWTAPLQNEAAPKTSSFSRQTWIQTCHEMSSKQFKPFSAPPKGSHWHFLNIFHRDVTHKSRIFVITRGSGRMATQTHIESFFIRWQVLAYRFRFAPKEGSRAEHPLSLASSCSVNGQQEAAQGSASSKLGEIH